MQLNIFKGILTAANRWEDTCVVVKFLLGMFIAFPQDEIPGKYKLTITTVFVKIKIFLKHCAWRKPT